MITNTKDFFTSNPLLGIISGFASWLLYLLHQILAICTNDQWLKIIAALGIWATAIVAILNLLAKLITWTNRVAKRLKASRKLKEGESI